METVQPHPHDEYEIEDFGGQSVVYYEDSFGNEQRQRVVRVNGDLRGDSAYHGCLPKSVRTGPPCPQCGCEDVEDPWESHSMADSQCVECKQMYVHLGNWFKRYHEKAQEEPLFKPWTSSETDLSNVDFDQLDIDESDIDRR